LAVTIVRSGEAGVGGDEHDDGGEDYRRDGGDGSGGEIVRRGSGL